MLLAARIAQLLLALAALRLATHVLSVEQYGMLALLTGINGLFGLFFVNPVGQHINRHTHEWYEDGSLLDRLGRYHFFVVAVALAGAVAGAGWFALGETSLYFAAYAALVTGGMILAGTWNATVIPMINMIGFRASSMGLAIVTTALGLLLSCWFASAGGSAFRWLAGQIIGLALGALLGYALLRRKMPGAQRSHASAVLIDAETVRTFCIPLAIATGLLWLLSSGYRFAVELTWGMQALGLMAVGLGIAGQLWGVVETLVIQFVYPHFYKAISVDDRGSQHAAYATLINGVAPLHLLLLGLIFSCSTWALAVLTDEKFHEAYAFALIGAAIEWCRVMANLLAQAAQVTKQTSYVIAPFAFASGFAILGMAVMIGLKAPLISIAWVLLLSGMVLLGAMHIQMRRLIPVDIDWSNILLAGGGALMLAIIAGMIGLTPLSLPHSLMALGSVGAIGALLMYFLVKGNAPFRTLLAVPLRSSVEDRSLWEETAP